MPMTPEMTQTPEQTTKRTGKGYRTAAGFVALLAVLGVAFLPCFDHMWSRWFPNWNQREAGLYARIMEGESYYTHGPLIPLLSLLIAALLLRHTKAPPRPRHAAGLLVVGAGLLANLAAVYARVSFVQGFALIVVLAGLVLTFWGWGVLRRLWFPLALLAFMVPLPEVTISNWNFHLKMFASKAGVGLANLAGIIVSRSGNKVYLLPDKMLEVANVCNGLRTLISLLAFGAVYAYVCRLRGLWRLGLFLASVPVAVASNSVRIFLLILVADVWDVRAATGWFHGASGVAIYFVAFFLMFGLERVVLWLRPKMAKDVKPLMADVRRGSEDEHQGRQLAAAWGSWALWGILAMAALTAAGSWRLSRAIRSVWTDQVAAHALPAEMQVAGHSLVGRRRFLDRRTLGILETEDYFCCTYEGDSVPPTDFCLVYSQDNRKGTHPPDECLEGSGEAIVMKGQVTVDGMQRPDVICRELLVQRGNLRQYFLYTYRCGNEYTGSFWRQQLMILANGLLSRDASGALVRVSAPAGEDIGPARAWCIEFMRQTLPRLDQSLRFPEKQP